MKKSSIVFLIVHCVSVAIGQNYLQTEYKTLYKGGPAKKLLNDNISRPRDENGDKCSSYYFSISGTSTSSQWNETTKTFTPSHAVEPITIHVESRTWGEQCIPCVPNSNPWSSYNSNVPACSLNYSTQQYYSSHPYDNKHNYRIIVTVEDELKAKDNPKTTYCQNETINFSNFVSTTNGVEFRVDNTITTNLSLSSLSVGNHTLTAKKTYDNGTKEFSWNITVNETKEITSQPVGATICQGGAHTFRVEAKGGNLTYQWKKDGTPFGTTPSITISNAKPEASGTYKVEVSGGTCGNNVTSNSVRLTVNEAASITSQPSGNTICQGGAHTFRVEARGHNISYQWKKDGNNVGTNANNYEIRGASLDKSGNYTVTVSGTCENVTSNPVRLTVNETTAIISPPSGGVICQGGAHTFTVAAKGHNLSYQWMRGSHTHVGGNSNRLTLSNTKPEDSETYKVTVTGSCENVTSNPAQLTVNERTEITSQPTDATICQNSAHTFRVEARGHNLSYQWKKQGVNIPNANTSSYEITAMPEQTGTYTVTVNGSCENVTSNPVTLSVHSLIRITRNVEKLSTVCVGNEYRVSVGVIGTDPTYQWYKHGQPIATSPFASSYTITSTKLDDAANYHVTVSGSTICRNNHQYSDTSRLTIKSPISITSNPQNVSKCVGETHTFSVAVTGDEPTYQWYKKAAHGELTTILNATGDSYTTPALTTANHENKYYVKVSTTSTICPTAPINSTEASIKMSSPAHILEQPLATTYLCLTNNFSVNVAAEGDRLAYQWRKNEVAIPNANASSFSIDAIGLSDIGYYSCIITGACGSPVNTIKAVLKLNNAGTITFAGGNAINTCVSSPIIDLTNLPSEKGGVWKQVSGNGNGLTYSATKAIYTPSSSVVTALDPNILEYTFSQNGCTSKAQLSIYVKDNTAVPTITGIPALSCPSTTITPVANSVGSYDYTYEWYKGTDKAPFNTSLNPSFKVAQNTALKVRSKDLTFNCFSAFAEANVITPFDEKAEITADKLEINMEDFILFDTNNSMHTGNTYRWDFGDGAISTEKNPKHYYYRSGTFYITLTISSNLGCDQSYRKSIKVNGELSKQSDLLPPPPIATRIEQDEAEHIYPNPTLGTVTIESKENSTYYIMDVLGKIISEGNLRKGKNLIHIEGHAGVYLINRRGESGVKILKK